MVIQGRRRRGGRGSWSRPTFCAFHLTFDRSKSYHYGICVYARAHDWYANCMQNSWCWFSNFVDLGMSVSHSPAIGDKPHQPIELLTNAERCNFGHGLIICGRGFKILRMRLARLIVTKLYIARASPIVKPFLQPYDNTHNEPDSYDRSVSIYKQL